MNSMIDGLPLPQFWLGRSTYTKSLCIRMLASIAKSGPAFNPDDHRDALRIWSQLSYNERVRVKRHLQAVGSVPARSIPMTTDGSDAQGRPQVVKPVGGMLYPTPNGGQRILPPIYSKLKTWWLRATGHRQEIETMNDGHLENSLKLMHESTGNLLGKCTSLLGKIHAHMDTQPEIQRRLVELNLLIGALDVDDVYPVYKVVAAERSMRRPPVVMMDLETTSSDIDIAIGNW